MRTLDWIVPAGLLVGLTTPVRSMHLLGQNLGYSVHTGAFGPEREVRLARPTFRWEIWAADPAAEVREVELRVDGQPVSARYDPAVRSALWPADRALAAGPHHVEYRVTFNNGMTYTKDWDMRIDKSPILALPAPNASQLEALAAVNEIRARYHLPPARLDDALDVAALGHSEYLAFNKTTGHGETPGKNGFVGATGGDRLSAYGWTGGSWEDVSYGAKSARESVENLFDAPYHRVPFLQVGTPVIGAGFADDRFTIEFGQSAESGTAVSPPDGATGIPCSWHDFERPNPTRMYVDAPKVTGYPIVIAHFAPGLPRFTKMFGWLSGPDQKDVPCWINTPLNDDILRSAAILIPKLPLRPNTVYRAGFDGRDSTGATVRKEVTFTTGG